MNTETIAAAVAQLSRSVQGRNALMHLLSWLDDQGLDLDQTNKAACLTLLNAAWGPCAGTARDAMRDALVEAAYQNIAQGVRRGRPYTQLPAHITARDVTNDDGPEIP